MEDYLKKLNEENIQIKGLNVMEILGISNLDALSIQEIIEAFNNLYKQVIDLKLEIAEKLQNHVTDYAKVQECRQKEDVLLAINDHPYLSKLWDAYQKYTENEILKKRNEADENKEPNFYSY